MLGVCMFFNRSELLKAIHIPPLYVIMEVVNSMMSWQKQPKILVSAKHRLAIYGEFDGNTTSAEGRNNS